MIPWTTPTMRFRIRGAGDIDLATADSIVITLVQTTVVMELTGESVKGEGNRVSCILTQEQSGRLQVGSADVQINWTWTDAETNAPRRGATKVKTIQIDKQLLKRVI